MKTLIRVPSRYSPAMTDVLRTPRRLAWLAPVAVVLGWIVVTWIVGLFGTYLSLILLLAAVIMVPSGFVAGVVLRVLLVRARRRAAMEQLTELDAEGTRAAASATGLQRIDRRLAIGLLVAAALLGAQQLVDQALDAQGFVFGNTTPTGNAFLVAGSFELGLVMEALVAIPVSAVVVARLARSEVILAGEASALAAGGAAGRRVRASRAVSWIAYAVWSVAAVGSAIGLLLPSLR